MPTAVGCAIYPAGGNLCPPDSLDPSILIINGDMETKGRPNFTGLVYVIGRADIGSSTTIQGAMVISGEMQTFSGGSLDIWYNSAVLDMTRDNGPLAGAPGSWRDW